MTATKSMGRKHVPLSPLCPLNCSSSEELLLANIAIEFGNLRNMSKFDLSVAAVIKIWLHFSLHL